MNDHLQEQFEYQNLIATRCSDVKDRPKNVIFPAITILTHFTLICIGLFCDISLYFFVKRQNWAQQNGTSLVPWKSTEDKKLGKYPNKAFDLWMIHFSFHSLKVCHNSVKIQSKCNQNAVKIQLKCNQNVIKMQSKFSQNTVKIVKIRSKYSQNTINIQSKYSQNQSKYSQNAVKMQSNCSQNSVTSWSVYRLKSSASLSLIGIFFKKIPKFR